MSAFPWRRTADEKPEVNRDLLVVVRGKVEDGVYYRRFTHGRSHLNDEGTLWKYREDPLRPDFSAFVDSGFGSRVHPSHWAYLSDVPMP